MVGLQSEVPAHVGVVPFRTRGQNPAALCFPNRTNVCFFTRVVPDIHMNKVYNSVKVQTIVLIKKFKETSCSPVQQSNRFFGGSLEAAAATPGS